MATPFVSGTAVLVFNQHPQATAAEVRDAILTGADHGLTPVNRVSGNRQLNAEGAINASTFDTRDIEVTLTGFSSITAVRRAASATAPTVANGQRSPSRWQELRSVASGRLATVRSLRRSRSAAEPAWTD